MPLERAFNAFIIFLSFILGSYVLTVLTRLLKAAVASEGLAARMIKAVKLPVRFLAILLGLYYAAVYLKIDWQWKSLDADSTLYILIVMLASYSFSRLNKTFFSWQVKTDEKAQRDKTVIIFLSKAISVFIYLIGILVVFDHLGIKIAPVLAGLGVAGVAVALGLQQTLSNLFAAAFFILDKTFKIGDYIELEDGTRARIDDISWRSTKLRTIDGNTVILPNSKFVDQKISSFDFRDPSYHTSLSIGIAYDSDLEKVESAVSKAAELVLAKEKKVKDKEPVKIRFREFGESSINMSLLIKVAGMAEERRVKSELIKAVVAEFRKAGIEIPFPQRVIHQKK